MDKNPNENESNEPKVKSDFQDSTSTDAANEVSTNDSSKYSASSNAANEESKSQTADAPVKLPFFDKIKSFFSFIKK